MIDDYATLQHETEALHDRTIRSRKFAGVSTLLFLEHGTLHLIDSDLDIQGPALCYWPQDSQKPISLNAGARARILGLSDTIVLDAIGARSESVHLRMLVENPFDAMLGNSAIHSQITTLFDWMQNEIDNVEHKSPMSMAAILRLMLIGALRVYSPDKRDNSADQTNLLRQFRHLVELHYRDHWQMVAYANELGIDYDRLHRICKRETSRSPAELVHERLTAEAKARLENTGFPLKKIATDLGFSDASRFSHFFKRRTDMSPGAYRAIVSRPDGEDLGQLRRGFADWP